MSTKTITMTYQEYCSDLAKAENRGRDKGCDQERSRLKPVMDLIRLYTGIIKHVKGPDTWVDPHLSSDEMRAKLREAMFTTKEYGA